MHTDYRKLCVELFGTDDVAELRNIAQTVNKKNARNAGRKKKFTADEIGEIRKLLDDDVTINEIAERYGTSRQIISKYIHAVERPEEGYTLRMTYMYRRKPCTVVDVDFLNERIKIENRTDDLLHRAFGIIEEPTWEDFEYFLQERCFPETRGNVKTILKDLQLADYDTLQIVEKTQGRMAEDDLWLKFAYYPMEVNNGTN